MSARAVEAATCRTSATEEARSAACELRHAWYCVSGASGSVPSSANWVQARLAAPPLLPGLLDQGEAIQRNMPWHLSYSSCETCARQLSISRKFASKAFSSCVVTPPTCAYQELERITSSVNFTASTRLVSDNLWRVRALIVKSG